MAGVPKATVVITTKNRKDDLRRTLGSVIAQSIPIEVLVIDDGSTDETMEMVRREFPQARVERSEVSRGYIVQRNRGACIAAAPILFSIDDDATFSSRYVVEQTLAEFDDSRVGAVAIPYVDTQRKSLVMQRAPSTDSVWVTDRFIGTAHALRREVFLQLGGYREALFHQGEESDFCIRMLNAGYFVRAGNADVIEHHESPRRDYRRMDIYGRRNDVLFAWHNVPDRFLFIHLAATTLNGLRWGLRVKRPCVMVWGLFCGYLACLRYALRRRPVSSWTYGLFRRLKRVGPIRIDEMYDSIVSNG